MAKKNEKDKGGEEEVGQESPEVLVKSEKEVLLDLHKVLKDMGINSIGDLEVKISRLA